MRNANKSEVTRSSKDKDHSQGSSGSDLQGGKRNGRRREDMK
jgi:hypothetical protein